MPYYAKRELPNSDWKTQLAKKYDNIPKGAIVHYEGAMGNFYGNFYKVRYNGILYYVPTDGIEYRTQEEQNT